METRRRHVVGEKTGKMDEMDEMNKWKRRKE